MSVAGLCRLIWKRFEEDKDFPYAIRFGGSHFDAGGSLVLGENSVGLTCATFVLAIFESLGIALVDEPDWPIRKEDDLAFLVVAEKIATPEHFAVLKKEVDEGCKRIQPQEVVAACAVCDLPASFAATSRAAERVWKQLDSIAE